MDPLLLSVDFYFQLDSADDDHLCVRWFQPFFKYVPSRGMDVELTTCTATNIKLLELEPDRDVALTADNRESGPYFIFECSRVYGCLA